VGRNCQPEIPIQVNLIKAHRADAISVADPLIVGVEIRSCRIETWIRATAEERSVYPRKGSWGYDTDPCGGGGVLCTLDSKWRRGVLERHRSMGILGKGLAPCQ